MPDKAHEQTDKELKRLERQITKEYSQAAKEVEKKLTDYLEKFAKKDAEMQKKVASGQMSAEEYGKWRVGQMAMGERWKEMQKTLTKDLVNADKIAAGMINDSLPYSYANNYNYGTYEVEHGAEIDTSFSLYDHATVENLMKKDPKIIPKAKVDIPKDELWNRRKLTSAITQGILQGEAIPKIAKRLASVADIDRKAAIRNARTYTTAAENKGRIDSYDRAEQMGIKVKKKWMATLDDRTRVEHRHLDGQTVPNDEPFEIDGYEIMYPGDPDAEPEMIYNCRCTLVAEIEGIDYHDERNDSKLGDMTYEEWKHEKDKQIKEEPAAEKTASEPAEPSEKREVVNGTDISDTWVRRPDQFEFEIDDVLEAQGFNGLPKILPADEFEKSVKESSFIAQRTYSASDKATADEYRDMLYNGEWYVNCAVGGAQYGQGMYCAADYNGILSNGIKIEMETYQGGTMGRYWREMDMEDKQKIIDLQQEMSKIDVEKYGDPPKRFMMNYPELVAEKTGVDIPVNYTETLTLDPSAKIIKYSELEELYKKEGSDLDIGAFAALKGYDAINAEGHGESGSYTVILNRTKCIIKGE